MLAAIGERTGVNWQANSKGKTAEVSQAIIPASRVRYLSEISDIVRNYNSWANEQADLASDMYKIDGVMSMLK